MSEAVMIDSIDFRLSDDEKSVEVGLFLGEECQGTLLLNADAAKTLRVHLSIAIDQMTANQLGEQHG